MALTGALRLCVWRVTAVDGFREFCASAVGVLSAFGRSAKKGMMERDTRADYQPGPIAPARAERNGQRWTLVFARDIAHSPARIWEMLTDPAQLREWAPFDADRNLGSTGPATLTMADAPDSGSLPSAVSRAERPRLLEYTWGEDVLRWELDEAVQGTRLTLRHTLLDPAFLPKLAAGWHICLDVADRALQGTPIGRIVGRDARKFGWERLNAEYEKRFRDFAT